MAHENIKGSLKKGNYGDLLSTLERDFMNNNLDKIIERKKLSKACINLAFVESNGNWIKRKHQFLRG